MQTVREELVVQRNQLMFAQSVWRVIPEGRFKDRLRIAFHNQRLRKPDTFQVSGSVFVTRISGQIFRTSDPPFWVLDEVVNRYELRHTIRPGDIVIDGGAYHGILTLYFAARVGTSGKVVAVEPDSLNRAELIHNLQLNEPVSQVQVVPAGLWDHVGEVKFCERGALGSSALWSVEGHKMVIIPTTTVDAIVSDLRLPRVDLIKMNIEGAEVNALDGARNTIERYRPDFAIASNHIIGGQPTRPVVESKLRSVGYEVETITFTDSEWITYGSVMRGLRSAPVNE